MDLNVARSIAKQGKAAHKFWADVDAVLESAAVAEQLVGEAQRRREKIEAEIPALAKSREQAQVEHDKAVAQLKADYEKQKADYAAQANAISAGKKSDLDALNARIAQGQAKVLDLQAQQERLVKETQDAVRAEQVAAAAKMDALTKAIAQAERDYRETIERTRKENERLVADGEKTLYAVQLQIIDAEKQLAHVKTLHEEFLAKIGR
jgi:hypothetical protein